MPWYIYILENVFYFIENIILLKHFQMIQMVKFSTTYLNVYIKATVCFYRQLFDFCVQPIDYHALVCLFWISFTKMWMEGLSVLLILSHLVVLHHGWIVYFVYQEGMSNDFPRVYGRSASRRQVSPEEHLTASADRSPQDSLRLIDMSGNEQSLLSSLPFNCMKWRSSQNTFFATWFISSTI